MPQDSLYLMNLYRHIVDRPTLERAYSPSSCVQDLAAVLAEYGIRSSAARAQFPRYQTCHYGTTAEQVLDFWPAASPGRPTLIYIHGGYWQELSQREHSFPAVKAALHQINYIAINYGLAPANNLETMVTRCRNAYAWIGKHAARFNLDPARLHLSGCSAGGHLAAMVALTDWAEHEPAPTHLPASLTLLSGVFDLRPIPLTYINDAVQMSSRDALCNSPLLLIDSAPCQHPPTLIVHGENETSEFKRQSAAYAAALAQRGLPVQLHEIAGRNHFDLIFDLLDEQTVLGRLQLGLLTQER